MPPFAKREIKNSFIKLLTERPISQITVKDIVEDCGVNRNSFYYHFQDLTDLNCFLIAEGSKELLENCLAQPTLEDKIRYLLSVALNVRPLIQRTISTSYQSELEPLLLEQFYSFFDQLTNESASSSLVSDSLTASQRKLLLRYHSLAFLGLVRTWSKDDSAHMDEIVHDLAQFFKNKTH